MVDHASINVSNLGIAKKMYSAALKPLGYSVFMEVPDKKVMGFSHVCKYLFGLISFPRPDFWIAEAG